MKQLLGFIAFLIIAVLVGASIGYEQAAERCQQIVEKNR